MTRRIFATCLVALSLSLGSSAPAGAGAGVDGISDQSLPEWDGAFSGSYFANVFRDAWVGNAARHVTLARLAIQWNLLPGGYPRYRYELEAWLADVASLGLEPEIALTSFDDVRPASASEYETQLSGVLSRARTLGHPIRYLEAWNEPNNQGGVSARTAAEFTNVASAICAKEFHCTVIAGDFEDSPNVAAYEDEYVAHLNPVPSDWGVHPYFSVERESEAPFARVREHLPNGGAGEAIWFTEIAARKCAQFGAHLIENGEAGQAERASWLVNTLMKNAQPEHVFYYEFLLKERRQPSCSTDGGDSALYVPSADPAEPDRPRPAASYIWGGEPVPQGYLDGAFMANSVQAALTGGIGP